MLLFIVNVIAIGRVPRMGSDFESRSRSRHLAKSNKHYGKPANVTKAQWLHTGRRFRLCLRYA